MKILYTIDKIEEYLIAIIISVMIIINFGNVLSRYVLKASWSFSSELMLIMFIWVVMLASATAFKRFEHLGLPLLLDSISNTFFKKTLIILSGLISTFLIVVIIISGVYMVQNQVIFHQTTSVLSIPEWAAGISIPFGSLFIIFRIIQATLIQLKSVEVGEET